MTDRQLRVDGVPVASYVVAPELDIRLGPRPYLHPVRTLGGVTVTDALCFDHPWHLGASLAMAHVNGSNLWGGRPGRGAGVHHVGRASGAGERRAMGG